MTNRQLSRLQRDWAGLRGRYGIDDPREISELENASRKRQTRLRHLRARLEDLSAEAKTLETELSGIDRTLEALLDDTIRRTRSENREGWSPAPVLGYRIWDVRPDGLFGFREQWKLPNLTALCPTTGTTDEIPHTDGRCGDPPCGIYATKDLHELLHRHRDHDVRRLAVGLVGLRGKVVEHERGYRGQLASVLAIAFPRGNVLYATNDSDELLLVFGGIGLQEAWPDESSMRTTDGRDRDSIIRRISDYLERERERNSQWI